MFYWAYPKNWKTLYSSKVRSVLEYGAPCWNPYSKDIDALENVQKHCLCLVSGQIDMLSLTGNGLEFFFFFLQRWIS